MLFKFKLYLFVLVWSISKELTDNLKFIIACYLKKKLLIFVF